MHDIHHIGLVYVAVAAAVATSSIAMWCALQLRKERFRAGSEGAGHDPLTDLPNRQAIVAAVDRAIGDSQRTGHEFALMVLNVDRLKSINGSMGHEAGDTLLRELSRRLRAVLRRGDVLVRLAGDEFTVMASDLRGAHDAQAVVAKVVEALRRPFSIAGQDVRASLSIGISMFPLDGDSFEVLLRHAEAAMRCAKDTAWGSYRFYATEMSEQLEDRLALRGELRRALELGQLELHYQPKVDIATNRVRSAEALIRWRHPTRGMIAPGMFIPVAEETGLIIGIGEWVLREACRQVRAWLDAGIAPVRVAVNLSAKQFRADDLVEIVRSALRDAALDPAFLEVELTESSVMHDPEKSAATLQLLSEMGVHISIDDFGTGYSSLSHLRRFPLDKLKIDRSFVGELLSDQDGAAIVKAIISLAHSLRLRVVAEGVETLEQLQRLRELGCDQYQGYYCSPAVPAEAFARLVQHLRPDRPEYADTNALRTHGRLSAYTPKPAA